MTLASDFKDYCDLISFNLSENMNTTIREITKKLNSHYYDLNGESEEHMYVVGSMGRTTAVKSSSDLDLLFDLPHSVFSKYDGYQSDGQSELLQDVKAVLKERYSKTTIRGDGQVVVIEFSKYTVELVPGFKQSDGGVKYPDTHYGGSWKYTDPLSEQNECNSSSAKSNGAFIDFCHIIREWKNCMGFTFGGLLIDTFVFNDFNNSNFKQNYDFSNYLELLKDVLRYISKLDEDQSYWYALGSNQKVYNKNNGKFSTKAGKALKQINDAENNDEDMNDVLRGLLGSKFPKSDKKESSSNEFSTNLINYDNTEEFIEDRVPVDIQYSLRMDCNVSQKGFRTFWLSKSHGNYIGVRKRLEFSIINTNCPEPYKVLWKVRNVGEKAIERNCIRGQIISGNKKQSRIEHSDFNGPHYVECYLIKNGVCVARDKIMVPISITKGI